MLTFLHFYLLLIINFFIITVNDCSTHGIKSGIFSFGFLRKKNAILSKLIYLIMK